jgi:hypothetical protein
MKIIQRGFTSTEAILVVIVLAGIGGWVANIVKFIGMDFQHITGMLVVRGIGIFVPPLGAVLGFC